MRAEELIAGIEFQQAVADLVSDVQTRVRHRPLYVGENVRMQRQLAKEHLVVGVRALPCVYERRQDRLLLSE